MFLFVFSLWALSPFLYKISHVYAVKFDNPGVFGDIFGAINALFSGLAFAFIVITLNLQREELRLQRQELRNQLDEMAKQSEELKETNNEYKIQRFNSIFFSFLKDKQTALSSISYLKDGFNHKGSIGLSTFLVDVRDELDDLIKETQNKGKTLSHKELKTMLLKSNFRKQNLFMEYKLACLCFFSVFDNFSLGKEDLSHYFSMAKNSLSLQEYWFFAFLIILGEGSDLGPLLKKLGIIDENIIKMLATILHSDTHISALIEDLATMDIKIQISDYLAVKKNAS